MDEAHRQSQWAGYYIGGGPGGGLPAEAIPGGGRMKKGQPGGPPRSSQLPCHPSLEPDPGALVTDAYSLLTWS